MWDVCAELPTVRVDRVAHNRTATNKYPAMVSTTTQQQHRYARALINHEGTLAGHVRCRWGEWGSGGGKLGMLDVSRGVVEEGGIVICTVCYFPYLYVLPEFSPSFYVYWFLTCLTYLYLFFFFVWTTFSLLSFFVSFFFLPSFLSFFLCFFSFFLSFFFLSFFFLPFFLSFFSFFLLYVCFPCL